MATLDIHTDMIDISLNSSTLDHNGEEIYWATIKCDCDTVNIHIPKSLRDSLAARIGDGECYE